MQKLPRPSFDEESILWQKGLIHIAGADEVGRGAFAGPVVAASVILPKSFPRIDEIHDSKLLTPRKREALSEIIRSHAISFAIAEVSVPVINTIGIGKAAFRAFRKAIRALSVPPEFVLMDGFLLPGFQKKRQKAIIHGDRISLSIAAASIIAKVYRDNLMEQYEKKFASYGFKQHKGYGTQLHRERIKAFGLCKLHRTSFKLALYTPSSNSSLDSTH
jgi:ribonuclease HII